MAEAKLKVVNPWHLLGEDGSLPADPAVRAQAIRVAQCIEYGGTLERGYSRETLIQCRRRPYGAACPGLLHVLKQDDDAIHVFCPGCEADEYLIYEWEDTLWAEGMMEPLNVAELAKAHQAESAERAEHAGHSEPAAHHPDEPLTRALTLLGSPLTASQVRGMIATASSPMSVMERVLHSLPTPPLKAALERFLPLIMDLWNATPRPDLGGFAPNVVHAQPAQRTSTKIGANAPCHCGSGKKYKRCCMNNQSFN